VKALQDLAKPPARGDFAVGAILWTTHRLRALGGAREV
jgi:hypothetical protein